MYTADFRPTRKRKLGVSPPEEPVSPVEPNLAGRFNVVRAS
jgi:hypothetical protein